ncbi:hypothetical protein cypCar_00019521 [Cyprinus carpio]|nr:hypothetical protein cypCar_00019521 [Cyprinus carpio]
MNKARPRTPFLHTCRQRDPSTQPKHAGKSFPVRATSRQDLAKRPGIENLPCELQRNFTLMRELDNRAEEKKCEIDKLAEEYIKNVRNLAPDQRVEHLQKIQNGFSKCKEYSDDKVQLAMQTYEML